MSQISSLSLATVILLLLSPSTGYPQTNATAGAPPKVLQIFVERVKPGKSAAHEKVEAGWPQAFRKANYPTHYLAVTSMTGPSEAWFLTGYESFAAWEADQRGVDQNPALQQELTRLSQRDGELLSETRGIVGVYRDDLSYHAPVDIAQMRYFTITTFTVRPGYDSAFADARTLVNEGHDKAKIDEHWAVYQVISGMRGSTYLLFLPMKSLQQADLAQETHGRPYQDALGEAGRQQLQQFTRQGMLSVESALFAFSPKMSYPSKELAARDSSYWNPQ